MTLSTIYRLADKLIPNNVSHDRDWLPIYPRLFVILTVALTAAILTFNAVMLFVTEDFSMDQSWLLFVSVLVETVPLVTFYLTAKFAVATGLLLFGNFSLLATYVLVSTGFDSPALSLLPAIPFMAMLLGQSRQALIWTIAISILFLGTYYLKQVGVVLPNVLGTDNLDAARLFNWFLLSWSVFLGLMIFSFVNNDHARSVHEQRSQLQNRLVTDELTGLTNRNGLMHIMDQRGESSSQRISALMVFDFDNYSTAVSQFGIKRAERILVDVGQQIRRSLPDNYCVARIEEDCFAVYWAGFKTPQETARIANRIARSMSRSVRTRSGSLHLTASYGFARMPDDAQSGTDLLQRAIEHLNASRQAGSEQESA